jgi:hypothetical protein
MTTRRTITRAFTGDRGPSNEASSDVIPIHTVEQIGPKMSLLANGALLCKDVPIARVGWMVYGPDETPIKVDALTGIAYVHRDEAALFDPVCIGSFMGAAVVDEHPASDVTPDNWKDLAQGFATTNVRRGDGDDSDVLLADLIITDADLIKSVLDGKREVSCGYDSDYEQTGDGQGKQSNIVGNHIALVEKGRCGPRCAIGDRAHQPEGKTMTTKTRVLISRNNQRRKVIDARRKVLDAEQALAEAEAGEGCEDMTDGGEGTGGDTHIHIHAGGAKEAKSEDDGEGEEEGKGASDDPVEARFTKLETAIAAIGDQLSALTESMRSGSDDGQGGEGAGGSEGDPEAMTGDGEEGNPFAKKDDKTADADPADEKDEKGATKDSAALATSYAQVLAQAEVLVPGFRMPTFDAKLKRKATVDNMCATRRRALDLFSSTHDGLALVKQIHGSEPTVSKMACGDVSTLFRAASVAKGLQNNKGVATSDSAKTLPNSQHAIGTNSIADINARNAEFWAKTLSAQVK